MAMATGEPVQTGTTPVRDGEVPLVAAAFGTPVVHRGDRVRRRRVGIFVGIELDETGQLRLLAGNIRRQVVDEGTPVLAHGRLARSDAR